MTTFVIKVEANDLKDALDIVEVERNRGYKIWIEDEDGKTIDEKTVKKVGARLYDKMCGALIWSTAVGVAFLALFAMSLLAGD